jgi:hypothetical protein
VAKSGTADMAYCSACSFRGRPSCLSFHQHPPTGQHQRRYLRKPIHCIRRAHRVAAMQRREYRCRRCGCYGSQRYRMRAQKTGHDMAAGFCPTERATQHLSSVSRSKLQPHSILWWRPSRSASAAAISSVSRCCQRCRHEILTIPPPARAMAFVTCAPRRTEFWARHAKER